VKPRYAGAWHNLSSDGFRALISGLNKAAMEGYAPIHFSATTEGFAVVLEQRRAQQPEEPGAADSRSYPRFFEDED